MDKSPLNSADITIEVVYALSDQQKLLTLRVPAGTSAREAVLRSGMQIFFPQLNLAQAPLGIFGKALARPDERVMQSGERIEIYRPLLADPKEVRKLRAAKAAQARGEAGA